VSEGGLIDTEDRSDSILINLQT